MRGNLTSAHGRYGGDRYEYDLRDRLVAAGADGATADRHFGYDPLGRLDRVEPAGLAWEWDGAQLVTERRGGAVVARYVPGAGADEPLVWYDGAGRDRRRWLEVDERGSVVRVSDDANATVAVNRYDDWGVPGRGNLGRFQYTGQMWLPELRFYYYKARMYSPTLGRFLQPDPIGYEAGRNWYAYVGGDPVNAVDPSELRQMCTSTADWGQIAGEITGFARRVCQEVEDPMPERPERPDKGGGKKIKPEPQSNLHVATPEQEIPDTEDKNKKDIAICNSLRDAEHVLASSKMPTRGIMRVGGTGRFLP